MIILPYWMQRIIIFCIILINVNRGYCQNHAASFKTLSVATIVDCDLQTVWKKWTSPSGLCSFLGEDAVVELKIKGKYEVYNSTLNTYTFDCEILSYLPQEMLSFTWKPPNRFKKLVSKESPIWIVVYFDAVNDHTTRVRIFQSGFKKGKHWQNYYQAAEKDWKYVLNQLMISCQ